MSLSVNDLTHIIRTTRETIQRDREAAEREERKANACKYHLTIPRVGLCCEAYYKSKDSKGREHSWFHFPFCSEENCPLKHPELLQGRVLETEV